MTLTMSDTTEIDKRVERVNEIIAELESGEPSLSEGQELLDEGREHIAQLRTLLDAGSGTVTELDEET